MPSDSPPLIVGVGNALRGDDGVGPFVAEALAAKGLDARIHAGDGTGLIDLFPAHDRIVLVDAMRSGAGAGTLVTLDAIADRLPADLFHYSTHRFGLAEAVETARALGTLPESLLVYGIEGADFSAGDRLSPAVRESADKLIARIADMGRGQG